MNVTQKLIQRHLLYCTPPEPSILGSSEIKTDQSEENRLGEIVASSKSKFQADCSISGPPTPGAEIALQVDQTLMQDATGTMVMLELEAMQIEQIKTEVSVQYVDHNIVQTDFKNADDHLFLQTAAQKYGIHYSPPGNGVSHPVHMEKFGIPGKCLIGSDSHTCAAGALGMLAFGSGGLEVAFAMAGQPYFLNMPKILGVKLTGKLPDWVSAKDVILEMLRRYNVDGGVGKIIEYYGPGLASLTAMDRHVIANMGAELGATTSVFPSDVQTYAFLKQQGRESSFQEILADPDASYDLYDEIDLSALEPLIACPSSPGNVVPVREVAGREIFQAMIGSSANPSLRDFAIPALVLKNRKIHSRISFDINPTSRQVLENLVQMGHLESLIHAGARIHQAGCNGCVGMGQAPATNKISLRTVPRNFPGRSGTKEDQVYLCSPETAVASAICGEITDPRDLEWKMNIAYPLFVEPENISINEQMIHYSYSPKDPIIKGPNIKPIPLFEVLESSLEGPITLKLKDHISTDDISPAGTTVLPFRSNIPEISKYTFLPIDRAFYERALHVQKTGSFLIAGWNYGQGSAREHAALAPRYLGIKAVLAKSFARIHRSNLINFGIIPLEFVDASDWDWIELGDVLSIENISFDCEKINIFNKTKEQVVFATCAFSDREKTYLSKGGLINYVKEMK